MTYWKKRKFWQKDINTDESISRELNDTRYICREVVKYLKQLCKNVRGTRGKVTAELAYHWGFIKDRGPYTRTNAGEAFGTQSECCPGQETAGTVQKKENCQQVFRKKYRGTSGYKRYYENNAAPLSVFAYR